MTGSTLPAIPVGQPTPLRNGAIPPLENGDRLTRAEFERRYEATPDLKKAELIEGIVHLPSPVTTWGTSSKRTAATASGSTWSGASSIASSTGS